MSNNNEVISENCLQRIGRLQERPTLLNMEYNLFPSGPLPGEVVEIFGDSSVGKTYLLIEFVKKCILPKHYKGIIIAGLEAEVIFLNTDIHFNVITLVKVMNIYLHHCFPTDYPEKEIVIDDIIKISLKKCIILNAYNSEVLHTSFYLIQRLLTSNDQISLLIIDSISAFYWQDRMRDGARKMDSYIINILKNLHKCLYPFKITILFTRPEYFQTKTNFANDCSSNYDLRNINTSVRLKPFYRESGSSHMAEVRTSTAFFVKFFTIGERGILWSL